MKTLSPRLVYFCLSLFLFNSTALAQLDYPSPLVWAYGIDSLAVNLNDDGVDDWIVLSDTFLDRHWEGGDSISVLVTYEDRVELVWSSNARNMGIYARIHGLLVDDIDNDGRINLVVTFYYHGAFHDEIQVIILDFDETADGRLTATPILETRENTRVVSLGSEFPFALIILRHFSPPHYAPYDSEPWWEWSAVILPDYEKGGMKLGNRDVLEILNQYVDIHVAAYQSLVERYRKRPGRALAERILIQSSNVLAWLASTLSTERIDQWVMEQSPLFKEFQQYREAFRMSDAGVLLPLDPLEELQAARESALDRVSWIFNTWGGVPLEYRKKK